MTLYDFIIVGGGVAGLSLAYHLAQSQLCACSILIIDKETKTQNDRTLSFWTDQPTLFDNIVYRSWSQLEFVGENLAQQVNLGNYRYQMIRGSDFYRFVREQLDSRVKAQFLQGTTQGIADGDEWATVSVNGETYAGRWVFDSRFKPANAPSEGYHQLNLYFKGWEIETPAPAFNTQTATLMDFRTPQQHDARFFYVLPFSARRALVEYSLFSTGQFSQHEGEQVLRHYLETTLGLKEYRVLHQEGGLIPVTDRPFPRQLGRRIMTIGAAGGRVKPSSGYAFWRIQQDSAQIVRSLQQKGHPFAIPSDSAWYRLCDSLMLQVMARHGGQIEAIFTALFKNNPIRRILRFLDEQASLSENLALIISLPPRLFVQALLHPPGSAVQPDFNPPSISHKKAAV